MENTNSRNLEISRILILLGSIIFIISTIDLFDICFPLRLSSNEWVFGVTQSIIASVLAPILAIALLLTGFYLAKDSYMNKKILNFEKVFGFISFVFAIALTLNLLLYSLSVKSYEAKIVSSIKSQQEATLKQFENIKNTSKIVIPEAFYKSKVEQLNKAAGQQIKMAKKNLLRKNIKAIAELLMYIGLYFGIGKSAFDSSKNNLLKLKFANK